MSNATHAMIDYANHEETVPLDTADPKALAERLNLGDPEGIAAPYRFQIVRLDGEGAVHSTDGKLYVLGGQLMTRAEARALPKDSPYKEAMLEHLRRAPVRPGGDAPAILCQWRGLPNVEICRADTVRLEWPTTPVMAWPDEPEADIVLGRGPSGEPGLLVVARPK